MMIRVNCRDKLIRCHDWQANCRIGRGGFVDQANGREGDEKTPLGQFVFRFGLYRADRLPRPPSALTFRPIRPDDGWCDDPQSPAYNRYIRTPFTGSYEPLWRDDGAYDIVLVMSHNDSPPEPGLGSAVFWHIAQPDDRETLGCIALTPDTMVRLLPHIRTGTVCEIIG